VIPAVEVGGARVFLGDCRDVLKTLPDNSVDSIVTDPPYELGFMGKKWDNSGIAYDVTVWQECLRVLKPGGHILAFGGSRTWHRLAVAVEDAGFELRDSIAWLYGSGFPKSLDISKAIEKKAGVEPVGAIENEGGGFYGENSGWNPTPRQLIMPETQTAEGKQWEGWGTALKPAFEPVVVGRKPLGGRTVAENVLAWGVGGLNIDGSRIAHMGTENMDAKQAPSKSTFSAGATDWTTSTYKPQGRWPANVILDEVTAGLLDEQSGVSKPKPGRTGRKGGNGGALGEFAGSSPDAIGVWPEDVGGGASRFFYVAKASKRDRNEGLEGLDATSAGDMVDREEGSAGMNSPRAGAGRTSGAKNFHPTVKPTQLMRYLIKLVTPFGGVVLDPFTGSGSTGKAALLDGFQFVGAELTEEYLPIIEGRLRWASEQEAETDDTLF